MVEDSDEDDDDIEVVGKMEDVDDKDVKTMLSPEDAKYSGELADGVGRIKVSLLLSYYSLILANEKSQLKRQHSAEPMNANARKSPASLGSTSVGATPPAEADSNQTLPSNVFGTSLLNDSVVGSPLKKHRASVADIGLGMGLNSSLGGDVVAAAEAAQKPLPAVKAEAAMETDDEL